MLYIITFAFFAFFSYREIFFYRTKKSDVADKAIYALCIAYLLILTSIRGGVAGDYVTYKEVFDVTDTSVFSIKDFPFEPLYSGLQWICKKAINNFQFFLLVIGTLVIVLELEYAKYFETDDNRLMTLKTGCGKPFSNRGSGRYFFTILLMLWGLYYANIVVIRSTIALMICLYSTKFIVSKRVLPFLMCVLIATGFHYSALCFLPAYWIFHYKSSLSTKLIIAFILSILLMAFMDEILLFTGRVLGRFFGKKLDEKIQSYLSQGFTFGVGENLASKGLILFGKAVLNMGALLFVGCLLWDKNKENSLYTGYLNLYICGCILYLATLSFSYAFARVSIFYNIFQIPLLMFLFEKREEKQKRLIWILFVAYLFARMTVNLIVNDSFNFITFFK